MGVTRQLFIVHVSDIHFGKGHLFNPPITAAGDLPRDPSYPTLARKLLEDLDGDDPGCPMVLALTGDFAQIGSFEEFAEAEELVRTLAEGTVLGQERGLRSVFCVPGNHDVLFSSEKVGQRWQQWTDFHNRVFGTNHNRDDPWSAPQVHDRVDDLGAVIVTLNSAIRVQEGKPDEDRGHVDNRQLEALEDELTRLDRERLDSAIRVALIHHHPVLIPALVEGGRGHDAVHNAGMLLTILRRFGFHLVLHGHKHNPHVFTEDSRAAYVTSEQHPILVAAGGSAGSKALPASPPCGNTYNQITIKWLPEPDHTRVRVVTRGLTIRRDDGETLLPGKWSWETLKDDDRQFVGENRLPPSFARQWRPFDDAADAPAEETRKEEYGRLRGWFPVVEVMPSLQPPQHYEARLWVVRHGSQLEQDGCLLVRVTWFAGPKFPVVTIDRADDENLCGVLHYWGPMLVQARLEFEDGYLAPAHLYARLPGQLGLAEGE